jgi:hypothetical protein
MCLAGYVVVGLWLLQVFLTFRVSSFRSDRPPGGYFGAPYMFGHQYFDRRNFRPEGHRLLELLWLLLPLWFASILLAVATCT